MFWCLEIWIKIKALHACGMVELASASGWWFQDLFVYGNGRARICLARCWRLMGPCTTIFHSLRTKQFCHYCAMEALTLAIRFIQFQLILHRLFKINQGFENHGYTNAQRKWSFQALRSRPTPNNAVCRTGVAEKPVENVDCPYGMISTNTARI